MASWDFKGDVMGAEVDTWSGGGSLGVIFGVAAVVFECGFLGFLGVDNCG